MNVCMYVCMSVRNGFTTEVYEFTYRLCTLQHVPLLVRLSSRYDGRLTGKTTTPLTSERDRQRTAQRPTHVLKSPRHHLDCASPFRLIVPRALREAHDVHAYT